VQGRLAPDISRLDIISPLRWTCKSRAKLTAALTAQGWRVSSTTVGRLLHELGYHLQSVRKSREGTSHPVHGELQILKHFVDFASLLGGAMRDLVVLFLHLLATVARLAGPGGARAVVAESVLVKHQLLILNRSRRRSPNLRLADRVVAGVCTLLMRPSRLVRAAIVLKPSTLLRLHRALTTRKYRRLFSATVPKKPGPKGPSGEVMAAIVDMKQRNPTWGCPRIAQQMKSKRRSH
jgi:Rhodopirellula transposase DDE domain